MSRQVYRIMTDSTTAADNPANVALVAGYTDGRYANLTALRKRYPHATIVTITVFGQGDADVVDRETGDASAATAAGWALGRAHAGAHPTIYLSVSQLRPVMLACQHVGLGAGDVSFWTAHYTGQSHMCSANCWKPYGALPFTPNIVATQYDDKGPQGQHYDRSLVAAYWPGVDPAPAPARDGTKLSAGTRRDAQQAITLLTGINTAVGRRDKRKTHITDGKDRQLLRHLAQTCDAAAKAVLDAVKL